MKLILGTCAAILLVAVGGFADQDETQSDDRAAITQACLDYFEGWYEGSAERMERALSPELMKRAVFKTPTGRDFLQYSPFIAMVEWTRTGRMKAPVAEQNIKVEIYDIDDNIASAKVTSNGFHDFVHLAKMNGEWKIVNVLWRPVR